MDNEDLYDSDLEDLILTGKKIQVVYFDSIEQFKLSENELDESSGFNFSGVFVKITKI